MKHKRNGKISNKQNQQIFLKGAQSIFNDVKRLLIIKGFSSVHTKRVIAWLAKSGRIEAYKHGTYKATVKDVLDACAALGIKRG